MPLPRHQTTSDPSRMGMLLVAGGFIHRHELPEALQLATNQGVPLCQLLQRRQRLGRLEKNTLLDLQARLRKHMLDPAQPSAKFKLGYLALLDGKINQGELDKALVQHTKTRVPLGSILLKKGIISVAQLTRYLRLQERLLAAATAALLGFSSMSHAGGSSAGAEPAWGSISAKADSSPHSLSANWRRPGLVESLTPVRYSHRDEILRSKGGKVVLRLTETGVEFRKFF